MVLVFLSQQTYFRGLGKTLISAATNKASSYVSKGPNLAMPNITSQISNRLQGGGAAIQNELSNGEQKISDAEKNISNYFSGIANSIAGKNNNSCQAQPTGQ